MKKYLIVILIIIIYTILTIFSTDMFSKNSYLIIDPKIRWLYKDGKWENIKNVKNLRIGKAKIYDFNTSIYLGKYYTSIKDGTIKVEKKLNEETGAPILIFKGKEEFDIINYKEKYEVDDYEITKILENENIKNKGLVLSSKIIIDVDRDGMDETIYTLSNCLEYDSEIEKYYSLIYLKKGNKYTKIASKISEQPFMEKYSVLSIIDFTKDGNYEIILSMSGISFDSDDEKYSLYELKDNKYVELITT